MTIMTEPFKIGESVRILNGGVRPETVPEVYTVLRCNEPDSPNPSYVIESALNHRQRREFHNQLVQAAANTGILDAPRRQEAP